MGVTASLPRSITTDAEFRSIVSAFRQAFADQGLVRTSDTGQIDPTTVTRAATNAAAGYEIYRFNDALQATSPVFIKFEYGTGGAATVPQFWITVGTGSDGGGTITGTIISREVCGTSDTSSVSSGTASTYFFSSSSRMGFFYNGTSSTSATSGYPVVLCVERGRDSAGVEQGDCLLRGHSAYNMRNRFRAYWLDGGSNPSANRAGLPVVPISSGGHVTKAETDVVASVPMYVRPDKQRYGIGLMTAVAGDVTRGTPLTLTVLGEGRQAMPVLDVTNHSSQDQAFSGASSFQIGVSSSAPQSQPLVLWD